MFSAFPEKLLLVYARRFPIRRGKLRVVNKLWRVALCGRDTHRLAELDHGRFTMPCDLQEMLQRQCYFFGTYFMELDMLRCWERLARAARVVFDVGASAAVGLAVAYRRAGRGGTPGGGGTSRVCCGAWRGNFFPRATQW